VGAATHLARELALGDFNEALERLIGTRPRTFAGLIAKARARNTIEPKGGDSNYEPLI
jgi:hypothetical protein